MSERRFCKVDDYAWLCVDEVVAIDINPPYGVCHSCGFSVNFLLKSGKTYRVPVESYEKGEAVVQRFFDKDTES